MFVISPADHNIIEEIPYHEDRGEIDQVQGQGSEQYLKEEEVLNEEDSSFEKKQRKSITLFEMNYDDEHQKNPNKILESF